MFEVYVFTCTWHFSDLHKLNLRDDDRYSSTEDDFPGKSSDDEHERASDVRDGQSFDNVNRRSTSGIVRRVRTGPSTSRFFLNI